MKLFLQAVVSPFAFFCFISCDNRTQSNAKADLPLTDTLIIPEKYNLEIRPSTKIKCDFIVDRPKETYITNKLFYLETTRYYRLLAVEDSGIRHGRNLLWPCNIPNIIQHGDTFLIFGQSYVIFATEQLPGLPFVIDKIIMHDDYSHGLNRLFR